MSGREHLKIGVYVLGKNPIRTYAKDSYDVRVNAGMSVVCDILKRAGFTNISFCSGANAHRFDVVMFSVTGDCDFWPFVSERTQWERSKTKVVVGGAAVLNPRPFLGLIDYFVLGRAEGIQDRLMQAILDGEDFLNEHVVSSNSFSVERQYSLNQVSCAYPHEIQLPNGKTFVESDIGCNHKCLFCNYTWSRTHIQNASFRYGGLWADNKDVELAIIDMDHGESVNLNRLRNTAIDGLSERIRFMVNKKITRGMLQSFLLKLGTCEKPHQVKFYNIVGYPTETEEDWEEFLDDIKFVDRSFAGEQEKKTGIILHNTPFRAMPATPLACAPMKYKNFRGRIAKVLGGGRYPNKIFYKGNAFWAVESIATDSLAKVIQSAIVWRGTEQDTENIVKIARSRKFAGASSIVKQATLERYFDVQKLFGPFTAETLPTRNIHTFCAVERMWPHEKDGLETENQNGVRGGGDVQGAI